MTYFQPTPDLFVLQPHTDKSTTSYRTFTLFRHDYPIIADMKNILDYINPLRRLGIRKYSYKFPLVTVLTAIFLNEFYFFFIRHNPDAVGTSAIILFLFLIIYFAFRDGKKGGFIATFGTICYYIYIIFSRGYEGEHFAESIDATIILALLYLFLAWVIGWLKEEIDHLIEREANAKKRLKSIFQQLPVGILISDKNLTILQSNNKLSEILGITIPSGFKMGSAMPLESVHNGVKTTYSDSPITQAIRTGKSIANKEFMFTKDGDSRYVQVSASPIRNRDEEIIAAASIITDITEQKKIELRKDDFVNMASHELKTPLTSIKLYTEIIARKITQYRDKELQNIVNKNHEQIKRLQILVDDLLDVSRIQTGKLTFHKEIFDINSMIQDTIELTKEAAGHHPIIFHPGEKTFVNADKFRMYQVLTNLITNAVKYSPKKSKIIIKSQKQTKQVVISVQDFGIGIHESEQEKIFERLYQVFTAEKKSPGFGMGLFISQEIIKKHKGKIWVESAVGKGSTFYISLPLAKKDLQKRK